MTVYCTGEKITNAAMILQQDLFRLQEWADKWQMAFNVAKCKVLRITRKTKNKLDFSYRMSTPNLPIPTDNVPREISRAAARILYTLPPTGSYEYLCEVETDIYLCVILDNKLTFNYHIDAIVNKQLIF